MRKFLSTKAAASLPWLLSVCLIAASISACSEDMIAACDLSAAYGITVAVPGGSALSRLGRSISGTLTEGSYVESMDMLANPSGEGPAQLYGAVERTGEYSLLVRVSGYQDFKQDKIIVKKSRSGCHVEGVAVTATLTPIQ